jgi:murein DD-endopeptidase MepM/ murein hydrolase activator NlpD
MRRSWAVSAVAALVVAVVACVPARTPVESVPGSVVPATTEVAALPPSPQDETEPDPVGTFHVVEPGQTLWRIARAYGVPLGELAEINGVSDPSRLEVGATIFIPGIDRPIDVPAFPAPPPASPGRKPAPRSAPAAAGAEFLWPVTGGEVLSRFGARRRRHVHAGLDIRGSRGQEILAAQGGTVVFSGSGGGYGRMVVVDHGSGVRTVYAHNDENLVRPGETVVRGQPIALVGRSGNASTEHCHFEVRLDDRPVDPMPYVGGVVEARQ